jgi:pilus assembly protein CpaB
MSVTRIVILVVAVVAAGLAALLARGLLSGKSKVEAAPAPVMQMADVLVASNAITPGKAVTAADLRWQKWPVDALQPTYMVQEQNPQGLQQMEGAVARVALQPGEPVTDQKVVHAGKSGFLAATLTPGKRAIAVKISEETGAGGFILPNDHVDVIMTRRLESTSGQAEFRSATVLRNVRVLAIDQTLKEKDGEQVVVGKTATLELGPNEAEGLALAQAMGDISLSLISLTPSEGAQANDNQGELATDDSAGESSVSILRYGVESQDASGK